MGGLATLGLLALAAAASSGAGCKSTTASPPLPPVCEAFTRVVNGMSTCEDLCSAEKCNNPGNVCINNLCALPCAEQSDCPGGQVCAAATTDGPGGMVGAGMATSVCVPNPKAPIGLKCPTGNECNNLSVCPDGSNCDYTQCGGGNCSPDPIACSDVDGGTCTIGKCDSDSSPCVVQGCTQDQCKPLVCLSAGPDDAEAYCTMLDCHMDTDCAAGYYCASVRDAHPICGAGAQKLPGLCSPSCLSNVACTNEYGAGATCSSGGYCSPACVMAGAAGGTPTYSQGPWCTQRNECRRRGICDPCQTDLDCGAAGQHCSVMPMGTDKFCTADCTSDGDCADGFSCSNKECIPRYGTCKGTGKFCEPCHVDADCEAGKYCSREESGEERVCTAPIGTIPCTSDAQCPTSPSGQHGKCMDASTESSPGDGVYHTCWLPFVLAADRFQCWPENPGAACYTGADCFNKQCTGAIPAQQQAGACN